MSKPTKEEMKECLRLMRQGLPHFIDATEAILQLIENSDKGPEVDEEWIRRKRHTVFLETNYVQDRLGLINTIVVPTVESLIVLLREAGVRMKEKK